MATPKKSKQVVTRHTPPKKGHVDKAKLFGENRRARVKAKYGVGME